MFFSQRLKCNGQNIKERKRRKRKNKKRKQSGPERKPTEKPWMQEYWALIVCGNNILLNANGESQ